MFYVLLSIEKIYIQGAVFLKKNINMIDDDRRNEALVGEISKFALNKQNNTEKIEENRLLLLNKEGKLNKINPLMNRSLFKFDFNLFLKKFDRKILAYILAILGAFLFCIANVLLKTLTRLSPTDNAAINYATWGVIFGIISLKNRSNIFGSNKRSYLLHFRGFIGCLGLLTTYAALNIISPSDVISIVQCGVIITAIMARIFLKEKLSIAHIFAAIFALTGIILICKPKIIFLNEKTIKATENHKFSNIENNLNLTGSNSITEDVPISSNIGVSENFLTLIGVLFAIVGAFSEGGIQISIRKLCIEKYHYSIMTLYTVYYGLPVSFFISSMLVITGKAHKKINDELEQLLYQIIYSVMIAILRAIAVILVNLSFKYEEAIKISIMLTTNVLFSFILQYFVLDLKADVLSFTGTALIFLGIFIVFSFNLLRDKYFAEHAIKSVENGENDTNEDVRANCFLRFLFFSF